MNIECLPDPLIAASSMDATEDVSSVHEDSESVVHPAEPMNTPTIPTPDSSTESPSVVANTPNVHRTAESLTAQLGIQHRPPLLLDMVIGVLLVLVVALAWNRFV